MNRSEPFYWKNFSDAELLKLRFSDLKVKLQDTRWQKYVDKLYEELEDRGIRFRPHVWLSDEWFTPDGVSGIAIPFYLAHPRLMKLEKSQVFDVEGGEPRWFMRLLRHECGHAIDNAFHLRKRRDRQAIFGKSSEKYEDYYNPRPYSKRYVVHLDAWYSQSHPDEDFAETFAVWLTPRSNWRKRYVGWGAMKKLQYMNSLMHEIGQKRPPNLNRDRYGTLQEMKITLQKHYDKKRSYLGYDVSGDFFRGVERMFSDDPQYSKNQTALAFLRSVHREARSVVGRWTGVYQYTIEGLIQEIMDHMRGKRVKLIKPADEARKDFIAYLTVQTMNHVHDENYGIPR